MSNEQKNVMLSGTKHLYRSSKSNYLRGKDAPLSMTFYYNCSFLFYATPTNRFHVPFSQLYLSVLGRACQKYLLVSTAKLGCI